MFGRRREEQQVMDIDSLIGENIKIIGKIEGSGNLRIDGIVEGDIDYNGNLSIGETGKIKGNISCTDISLAGTVEGNIKSNAKLTILSTGRLIGDAEVVKLVVHEEGHFEGNCKMVSEKSNVKSIESKKAEKMESAK